MPPKRKAAPVTFVDFDFLPKDTSADEKTDTDEEEILLALDKTSSSESSEVVVEEPQIAKKTVILRSFTVLEKTVVNEKSSKIEVQIEQKLCEAKTPMQAAKNAFALFCPNKPDQSFIFNIQENGGNNKIYSYRGSRLEKDSPVTIKAYKSEISKTATKNQPKVLKKPKSRDYEDDGIVIAQKEVPPLANDKKVKSQKT